MDRDVSFIDKAVIVRPGRFGRRVRVWDTETPLIYNKEDLHNPWFVVE